MAVALPRHVSIVSAMFRTAEIVADHGRIPADHRALGTLFSVSEAGSETRDSTPVSGAGPLPLASLSRRFGALLIDWIMCLLVAGWFGRHIGNPWTSAVLVVEYAFFIGLFTQTPGMWVARIRCVSIATGRPIGIPRAALRGLLLALVIPALIMDRQTWRGLHDRAAGSVMVNAQPARNTEPG
jgi:uncharacterized RDD family membrane protein YckC